MRYYFHSHVSPIGIAIDCLPEDIKMECFKWESMWVKLRDKKTVVILCYSILLYHNDLCM